MGYVDRKDAGINPKKRLILTAGHLKDYLKQIESEHKFYELEMAEVVEVHFDETKSSFPKMKYPFFSMQNFLASF